MTVTARMRRPDAPVRAWRDRASRRGPWSFHLSSSCSTSSRVRLFCGMRELGKLPQVLGSCGAQELIVSSSQIQTSTMRVCSSPRSRRAASERLPSRNLPKSPRRRRRCLLKRMQSRRSSCRVRTIQNGDIVAEGKATIANPSKPPLGSNVFILQGGMRRVSRGKRAVSTRVAAGPHGDGRDSRMP